MLIEPRQLVFLETGTMRGMSKLFDSPSALIAATLIHPTSSDCADPDSTTRCGSRRHRRPLSQSRKEV